MRIPFIDGPVPHTLGLQNMAAHVVLHHVMEGEKQEAADMLREALSRHGLDFPFWALAHWTDTLIIAAHRKGFTFSGYDTRGRGTTVMTFVRDPKGPMIAHLARPEDVIPASEVPSAAVAVVSWFVAREHDDIEGARRIVDHAVTTMPEDFVTTALTMAADNLNRLGGCPL